MNTSRMLPRERLEIPVEVRVDGDWWPGTVEHRRQLQGRWQGFVRWSTGPGENRIGWYDYEHLRQV